MKRGVIANLFYDKQQCDYQDGQSGQPKVIPSISPSLAALNAVHSSTK